MKIKKEWLVEHLFNAGDPSTGESFMCGAPSEFHKVKAITKNEALSLAPRHSDKGGFAGTEIKCLCGEYEIHGNKLLKMPDEIVVAEIVNIKRGKELLERLNRV